MLAFFLSVLLENSFQGKLQAKRSQVSAHEVDGLTMIRFLYWLAHIPLDGRETELSAAQKLRAFREKGPHFDTLSFETISAHGPSGALIHYQSSQSNRKLTGHPFI